MAKRVAQMGATAAQLASYLGIARQVIINETTWRVHIMDGITLGGIPMARLSDIPDVSGFLTKGDATATYLTINNAKNLYLGKNDKAVSAETADTANSATSAGSATKASQDANGAVIDKTYMKLSSITSGTEELTAGESVLATGSLYFMYE